MLERLGKIFDINFHSFSFPRMYIRVNSSMNILLKKCRICRLDKPLSEFFCYERGQENLKGYRCSCDSCWNEKIELDKIGKVRCRLCKEVKDKKQCRGFQCFSCVNKRRPKEYAKFHADKYRRSEAGKRNDILRNALVSSKKRNLPFNLSLEDIIIPKVCPVLGIELSLNNTSKNFDSSPSIDRYIPELGYVKGNIEIISMKANRMKNSASIEDVRKLLAWMESRLKLERQILP